ncbi:hypothetical protein SAMN02745164_01912 [Marinitoga hydrogenitolerans DSM 16785]|uniref:Uncharacterized protein n=1 Tax=Marinitoga hydrogenitolerans (strain DSM 16785 / JCM 12826 / AT1271) TaxID=1122195 RepID=A0A1M4ZEX4_MARH1|nr:hypothetical protein [Marinitoga hydrogenitolerans]SHF16357.1 hypothetical protein SAMN02745164_01912 [Marinitoga hydrogenitolerans DSM 16785]
MKKILSRLQEKNVYLSEIIDKPNKTILDTVLYLHQLKEIHIYKEPLFKKAIDELNNRMLDYKKIQIIPTEKEITMENYKFTEYIFKKIR